MNKILICTNINQLINFHITQKTFEDTIFVCVLNKSVIGTELIKQIKNTSLKLSFKYIDNFANLKGTDFDLISRNDLNLDEINFINNFKIHKWYVVEDGIGDYMRSLKFNFNKCKIPYISYRIINRFLKFIKNTYLKLFKEKRRTFIYENKIINNLICLDKKNTIFYKKILDLTYNVNFKKNDFQLIIVGSLYSNYVNGYFKIYDKMNYDARKMSILPKKILYIPHPRMKKNDIRKIKKKYMWRIDNSCIPAEKIILDISPDKVWSTFGTSIIYLKLMFKVDCKLFHIKKFREYNGLKSYLILKSIYCFFKSIRCSIVNI